MKYLLVFVLVALCIIATESSDEANCLEDEFVCVDGTRCLIKDQVCDNFSNCDDGSDEEEKLCETWDYEYEEIDSVGGSWFSGWAGGDYDFDVPTGEDLNEVDSKILSQGNEGNEVEEKCSIKKCDLSGPLRYETNKKYRYRYEVLTQTKSTGPESNQTSSTLTSADIDIDVITACEMSLKIMNAHSKYSTANSNGVPTEPVEDNSFLKLLEQNILGFSMIGGEVDMLCPSPQEDPRTLNFKRGILSMIQNTMPQLHLSHTQVEKDVVGECEMTYDMKLSFNISTIVMKNKNIPSCKQRSHIISTIHSVPYTFPEESTKLPLINTESSCEQELLKGIILSSTCREKHRIIPLSSDKGEISTIITQKLSLKTKSFSIANLGPVFRRENLLFDYHDHSKSAEGKTIMDNDHKHHETVVTELLDLISSTNDNEDYSPARTFSHLVAAMRSLEFTQFEQIMNKEWNSIARKAFISALPMVGTASSVKFMVSGIVPITDESLKSLSYIQNPDIDVLMATADMFESTTVSSDAYLAIGSLLNNYCEHNPSCGTHQPVMDILRKISSTLKTNCKPKNVPDKVSILLSLRGLGNAGRGLNEDSFFLLNSCIENKMTDMEVRTTAIEAFRRVPCNESRVAFEKILLDSNEDSELRIQSYLGLMKCSNYETIRLVETVLSVEEVNQVGSFIWTHLTNIQETGSPSKIVIQSLISNRKFEEKFKSDFRKYSKNIEWSGFYNEMNVGAFVESNIIFSSKSYVPRTTSLNFTADLFGRSFNFFEIQSRFEGFEKEIAKFIGDFSSQNNNPIDKVKNKFIREAVSQSTRAEEYLEKAAEISFDLKLFGEDVSYHHISGMNNIMKSLNHLNPMKFLENLKEGTEFELEKSTIPLDSSYQIATSAGLPLTIALVGSADVDVTARVQGDVASILISQTGKIEGYLRPRISIDLKASMIVDSHSSQSGIELDSQFSTSTSIDFALELDGAKAISIDMNLPEEKMELFKASSKLILIHNSIIQGSEASREVVRDSTATVEESNDCSPNFLLLKSQICWRLQYSEKPSAESSVRMLAYGPLSYQLLFKKTDPNMQGFKFRYHWGIKDDSMVMTLLFNTPGATVSSNQLGFNLAINYVKNEVSLDLNLPRLSLNLRGIYVWKPNEKKLEASVTLNGQGDTTISVGYKIYEKSGKKTLIPTFLINHRGKPLFNIFGDMEEREKDDNIYYSVKLRFKADLRGYGKSDGTINGDIVHEENEWKANLNIVYALQPLKKEERINIQYNRVIKQRERDEFHKMERKWRLFFTQFPHLNCKGILSTKRYSGSIENVLKVSLGSDFDNPNHEVRIYQNLIFYGGHDQTTLNSTIAFKYPKNKLDVIMGVDFYQQQRDVNTGFIFQYAEGHAMKSRFHMLKKSIGPPETEASLLLYIPDWINIVAKGTIKEVAPQIHDFDLEINSGEDFRLEFIGHYANLSTRLKAHHKLDLQIKLPSRDIIHTMSSFHYDNSHVVLECQVKMKTGDKYKIRVAYISQEDDLAAHQRRVELELFLPSQTYFWHSEITLGEFITISNDIHMDRHRDLNLWLQIQRPNHGSKNIKIKFLWDSNRDPQKKAQIDISLRHDLFFIDTSIFFLGNMYSAQWQSLRKYDFNESEKLTTWHHDHGGTIAWKDNFRKLHEFTTGISFTLKRGNGAEFVSNCYLTTPFPEWRNNFVDIKYARDSDGLEASLSSDWHQNEFCNVNFKLKKQFDGKNFKGETRLEILSSLEDNLISLSTGALVDKRQGQVDANVYMQWDKDKVEWIIEARDNSNPEEVNIQIETKVLTTLSGYKKLSASADLLALQGSFALYGSAAWEELLYKLECKGDYMSVKEYLKGELKLTTPEGGWNDVHAKIRVYHDPVKQDENLQLLGRLHGKEVKLDGKVTAHPQDFRAELKLETPFDSLSEASIVLAHSLKEHYKTEAIVMWNKTNIMGLQLESIMNSLSDFLMSVTIMTPVDKYKDIRAEIRNFFSSSPDVCVHSRIFGQLNEKKYGIGGKYRHGKDPRLAVGLELYSTITDLEEVSFNIADRSVYPLMKYAIDVKYGKNRALAVATEFSLNDTSLKMKMESSANLASVLGEDMEDVEFVGNINMNWVSEIDFTIQTAVVTKLETYKIFVNGNIDSEYSARIKVNLALPIIYLRDLEMKLNYEKMTHLRYGFLRASAISGHRSLFNVDIYGTLRDLSSNFHLPFQDYKRVIFAYKLLSLDISRSKFVSSGSVNDDSIQIDGIVFMNADKYITRMELEVTSTKEMLNQTQIVVEGLHVGDGFMNSIKITTKDQTKYEADILWTQTDDKYIKVEANGSTTKDGEKEQFVAKINYNNISKKPLELDFMLKGPKDLDVSFGLIVQKAHRPYETKITWRLLQFSSGSLNILLKSFRNERVASTIEVLLDGDKNKLKFFKLITDFHNRSARDIVDLGLLVDFSTSESFSDENISRMLVNGTLRQVTVDDVGTLIVHIEWPNLRPITFIAEANHVDLPAFDVRTSIKLDLGVAKYGFYGQVLEVGMKIDMNAVLWWQREGDLDQKKITFSTNIEFAKDGNFGNFVGKSILRLPMVKGLEVSSADFTYGRKQSLEDISIVVNAVGYTSILKATYIITELPAIQGNITLSTTALWSETPIKIRFEQSLTESGYYGNYNLKYPLYNMKLRQYEHESVLASLRHKSLVDGQEGVFAITSKLTKEKPVKLNYSFRFPSRSFAALKLGIAYEAMKMELRWEHSVTHRGFSKISKNLIELDNLLWPFGIIYTKTDNSRDSTNIKEVTDSFRIYDLDNKERKSTITFSRKKTAQGGRCSVIGTFFARDAELSAGYVSTPKRKGADIILSWAKNQKITMDFDWQERSESPLEKDQKLTVRIGHPMRQILLDLQLLRDSDSFSVDLLLNTDQGNPQNIPLKARIYFVNALSTSMDKYYEATAKISHPILPTEIDMRLKVGTGFARPLFFDFLFKYSNDSNRDLKIEAKVDRDVNTRKITNVFKILHINSRLLAEASGYLLYGREIYSFKQDFKYSNQNGSLFQYKIHGGLNLMDKTFNTQVIGLYTIIDLKMKIEEKEPGYWELITTSETHKHLPFQTSLRLHPSQPIFILTINNIQSLNSTSLSLTNPDYLRYNADTVVIEGGYEDQRYIHLGVTHLEAAELNYIQSSVVDCDFSLRLNHSKLLSCQFNWRKQIEREIRNEIAELVGLSSEIRNSVKEWTKQVVKIVAKEVISRTKPIVLDAIQTAAPLLTFYKNVSEDFKNDLVLVFKQIDFTDKEKVVYTSIQFSLKNLGKSLEKLSFVKKLKAKLSKGTMKTYVLQFITRMKQFYNSLRAKDPYSVGLIVKIRKLLPSLAGAYDQAAKKYYVLFRNALNEFKTRVKDWLRTKWHNVYNNYKPHILRTLHLVESTSYNLVTRLRRFMNKLGADIQSNSYIQTLQEMYFKIKSFYDQMHNRTLKQNLEMVYGYTVSALKKAANMFVKGVLPFMEDWKSELDKTWQKLYSYDSAKAIIDFASGILSKVYWFANKLDARELTINAAAFVIEHGYTIASQTAIQAQMRHIAAKTDMIWSPEIGRIRLRQKLPFDWITFSQLPQWKDFFEIPVISTLKRWIFPSTKFSILDTWYRFFNLNFYPRTWIPPFSATAYVIGENHLMTFDGLLIDFKGSCEHILAVDLIQGNWAITISYHEYTPKTINIYVAQDKIEFSKNFKVKINGKLMVLPNSIDSNIIWRTAGAINLEMNSGLQVTWNLIHDVVSITVPRTSFFNTGGLMGTYNNEQSDDLVTPDGKLLDDLEKFFNAWKVSRKECQMKMPATISEPLETPDICNDLFLSRSSPFKYCFYQVDPQPYFEMCRQDYQNSDIDTSSVALAYRERCTENAVPVKLPVNYVQCEYINATTRKSRPIQEGQIVTLRKEDIYNAVDVVLLVEINACNRKRLQSKQFRRFITQFDAGLKQEGVIEARFAVVAYGGPNPYTEPSLVSTDTDIFTSTKNVAKFIQYLDYPDEAVVSEDKTFQAITFASNLGFRSPVKVVFLLFPCRPCQESYGLDYSTMYHILLNNAATLHVFKEDYFGISKSSMKKRIFGYDRRFAYTSKDYKNPKIGDKSLKKQIFAPKKELGWCLALALETGGAVFTSELMTGNKKKPVERLGRVVGRRAGASAKQDVDQHCLCLSTQEVTPILRCDKWQYGDFPGMEVDFKEEDDYSYYVDDV